MTQRSVLPSLLQHTVGPSDMVACNGCLADGGTVGNAASGGQSTQNTPRDIYKCLRCAGSWSPTEIPPEGKVGAHGV